MSTREMLPAAPLGRQPDIRLEEKVRALRSPAAYDHSAGVIEAIETHFAWVFLHGQRAYKLKKPVQLGGIDLRTLAARQYSCAEEVRLNRRLARSIYLGITPLACHTDGALHVGGAGATVDWLVTMRRLPSELMLDRAIATQTTSPARLIAVGDLLARFYAQQRRIDFSPEAYHGRMLQRVQSDAAELAAADLEISSALVESVTRQALAACEHVREELEGRARERRIVEGHGDLRPEHVCLSDPPCIIDSLEFSLDLRTLDPGEEVAFLTMECERLGNCEAGERILESYLRRSQDPISSRLIDFYRCRRATVRALLTAWHLRDPQVRNDRPWSRQAENYLTKAGAYARRAFN